MSSPQLRESFLQSTNWILVQVPPAKSFWDFLLVGTLGILLFDRIVTTIAVDSATLIWLQDLKSWGLLLITIWSIYWLLHNSEQRFQQDLVAFKQTQVALRESEERFRQVSETIREVFWMSSADKGEVLYISPAYEEIWGRTCESLYQNALSFLDTIHPDDREQVAATFIKQKQQENQIEYRIIQPDGSIRWIWDRSFPVRDNNGHIYRVVGVAQDITDRKRAEADLRESEEFLKLTLEFTHIGSWDWRLTTNEVTWNNNHARLLGYTPDDIEPSYQLWRQRIHPEDLDWVERTVLHALETHTNFEAEYRIIHPDGSLHWLAGRGRALYDEIGQAVRMVGVIIDITDLKQAEQDIRQLNETLENQNHELEALVEQRTIELLTLINTLPDYIFVIDRKEMKFLFCNDQNARFIGSENRQQVEGKTIFECFSPEIAAELAAQNQQVFETGKTIHFQASHTTPHGTLSLDTYKIPLKHPNGDVYALIGAARDITEVVEARQKLADRTLQLEATNQELESFSYSVSHDLRKPLRHINGFVSALENRLEQMKALGDPEVAHYLKTIQESSRRMGQLIDGLLMLSRVGRRQMANAPVSLNDLVNVVLSQLPEGVAPESSNSNETVQFIVGKLPVVLGDSTLLCQVFVNLIDNAVKFSRDRHPAQIEIGSLSDGTVFIRDNGAGFQMEYADQLFGAFQRLHSQEEFEGTGIGLAIVQRIIHRYGELSGQRANLIREQPFISGSEITQRNLGNSEI